MEFPPATVKVFNTILPSAGGGYLRILPFPYTRWALRRLARENGQAVVIYFHPWEIDPDQPKINSRAKSRFRHYTNLDRMEPRLRELLRNQAFQSFHALIQSSNVLR